MLSSANDLTTAQLDTTVCVVGAGPAGLSLARALADKGIPVLVVESGGAKGSRRAEQLSVGQAAGELRTPVHELRKRSLGGTSRAWASNLAVLDDGDFEPRPDLGHSGWPLAAGDLDPDVEKAFARLGSSLSAADRDEQAAQWAGHPVLRGSDLTAIPIAATNFGDAGARWRDEIERSGSIHLLTDAHVLRLDLSREGGNSQGNDRSDRVDSVCCVATGSGRRFTIRARDVVLAGGAIELTRTLLLSDQPGHPNGLGNHSGHLGRWYQDHPFAWCGVAHDGPEGTLGELFFPYGSQRGPSAAGPLIARTAEAARRDGHTRVGIMLIPHRPWMAGPAFTSAANTGVRRTIRAVRAGHLPVDLRGEASAVVRGVPSLLGLARSRRRSAPRSHAVRVQIEPTPQADSTITLGRSVDRWGQRQVVVDWRLGDIERTSTHTMLQTLDAALRRIGGRFDAVAERADGWPSTLEAGYHQSGTTRMSADPSDGVVDPDGRLHGVANLWINSSAVFPSVGYANPTATVVALGLRLADRLAAELAFGHNR